MNHANPSLERDIQNVAKQTGLLPSIVRACLTAHLSDSAVLQEARAQALEDAAAALTRETPGVGPWGVPQHEHHAQWLRSRAKAYRPTNAG